MEDEIGKNHEPEDIPLEMSLQDENKNENLPNSPSIETELTPRPDVKSKGDMKQKSFQSSPQKQVAVQLEPFIGEILVKKRDVADKLEDELKSLHFDFKENLRSIDRIKLELNNQETHLLQSLKKIEGYMRQIFTLKKEADDMFERLKSTLMQLSLDYSKISNEYHNVYTQKGVVVELLNHYRSAQFCLRSVVSDLDEYCSDKELVEYYLVLKLLRKDLLKEDERRLKEAQRHTDEQRTIGVRARNMPLDVLAKEETMYDINFEIKDMRLKNIELDQQISNLLSTKTKDETSWHDIERWINKTYRNICEIIPPDLDEPRDTIMDQLQKLQDFVVMGNKIIERLHKEK